MSGREGGAPGREYSESGQGVFAGSDTDSTILPAPDKAPRQARKGKPDKPQPRLAAVPASVYREKVSDERPKAVSDHVRAWLFSRRKATRKGSATIQGETRDDRGDSKRRGQAARPALRELR